MPVLSRLLLAGRRVSRRVPDRQTHPRARRPDGRADRAAGPVHGQDPAQVRARHSPTEAEAARPATQASRSRFPGSRPDRPSPQSQSLSRSYGSGLPTSLTYIVLFGQRLITLETCCGYRYDDQNNSPILTILHSPRFSLAGRSTPDAAAGAAHSGIHGSPS